MSTVPTPSTVPPPVWQWPADVLELAAQRGVTDYLDPLLEATRRLFPTARSIRVQVEQDPELRDERWVLFTVQVPDSDVPDYVRAIRAWDTELLRFCPKPLLFNFVLRLHRVEA